MIALAPLVLPWVVALVLVRRHHHLDGATVGILVAVSLGLPTLWVAWAAYRGPRQGSTPGSGLSMAQVADQLAVAVGAQWNAEAAVRRLNDPYPLPVSWTAADPSLTDTWNSLGELATSGAGWPRPAEWGPWAAGPAALAGEGSALVDVLARVPTRRLVVLGEPGAGKTMLVVRLVLDLLARRAAGGPVPFLASIASWNPEAQDLRQWLAAQLLIDHAALGSPAAEYRTEPTQAAALFASGLILPILDGLDEIPDEVRGPAISRINDALQPGEQAVVTCRTQQYQDAVRPQEGAGVTLRGAAAVQLNQLDANAVRRYLCDDAAGPVAKARWEPVLDVLGTDAPAAQALSTPLMVGLARAIYNPRPGELTGALRDPAELCSSALEDRKAVESLLFDGFIPAVYRDNPAGRWTAQDAERWLVFLARYLERTIASPDLAWWRLSRAIPRYICTFGAAAGVIAGVMVGVALATGNASRAWGGAAALDAFGVVAGVVIAIFITGAIVFRKPAPVRGIRWRPSRLNVRFGLGSIVVGGVGVVFGAVFGIGSKAAADVAGVAVTAGALGVFAAIAASLFTPDVVPLDLSSAASPPAALAADRRTGIDAGARVALAAGVVIGAIIDSDGYGATAATLSAIVSLAVAWAVGGFVVAAWPSYAIARMCLAMRHRLPWPLVPFLADAHQRGVLRQVGVVYQFRHIELQHRLANREAQAVSDD